MDRDLDRAASGPRWLLNDRIAEAVLETLQYGDQALGLYGLRAWVLMPNHVHILIYPRSELTRITKSIKGYSARRANAILERRSRPFWQNESYDHWVRGPEESDRIVRYIEGNPVSAGLAKTAADWRWSSASRTGLPACRG